MVMFLRILFSLLILANLLFFVWTQGYLGKFEDGREPQRLSRQLEPEKLRVRGVEAAPAASAVVPPSAEVCRLVSGLTLAEAQHLHAQVPPEEQSSASGLKLTVKPLEIPPRHWVFIPPLANKVIADKKVAELKQRGIANYELVQEEGADKFAISLGMFNTQDEANEYLQSLQKRGVKSATIQVRARPAEKAQLEARASQELLQKRLPELLSGIGSATVADCPEGH